MRRGRSTAPTPCRMAWCNDPLVFVSIAPDGMVTIFCHRAEMGQGVRTGMPMIVADELEADWARVQVVQAPGDEAALRQPGHRRLALAPGTSCSRCANAAPRRGRCWKPRRRSAGASPPTRSTAQQPPGACTRRRGRKLGYGELAAEAAKLPVPAEGHAEAEGLRGIPLYRQGRAADRRRLRHHAPGAPSTARTPPCRGMLFAVVARPPVFGGDGRLGRRRGGEEGARRAEDRADRGHAAAGEIPAARRRRRHRQQHLGGDAGPRGAEDHLERRPARQSYDSETYRAEPERDRAQAGQGRCATRAMPTPRLAKAAKSVEAEYYAPHLAHATMEPPAATVRIARRQVRVSGPARRAPIRSAARWPSG